MTTLRTILAIVVTALAVSAASAQSGGLTVRVTDAGGLPLPGATVTISHDTGYVKQTAVAANGDGLAEFPVLRPGRGYAIEVAFSGFGTRRFTGIHISIGGNQSLDVQLTDRIEERLRVVAEGAVVDLEQTTQATRFSDEFMQDLPVPGRFYQNVLSLAPGVQDADGDGNPNVHGSRDRDFKAIVSGVANVDPLTGQQMSQVNPNSIEEMEVITAGASVEFSRAQGGFARIIQKQGSNEFEGVFEFYYRGSTLDGDGAGDFSNLPDAEFDWYQPAFQISGPIVKDKVWYRLSHELIEREIPVNITSGIEVMTDDQEIHSDQITWQVSARNKLAYQFQSDPRDINNFGVSSTMPADSAQRRERASDIHSITWTASFSPKILVESQVAWQDLNTKILPSTRGVPNRCVTTDRFRYAHCVDLDTGQVSGSFYRTLDDHSQRLTVRSQAEVFGGRLWGMSHQLKIGFLAENERYFRFLERGPDLFRTVFQPEPIPTSEGLVWPPLTLVLFARAAVPEHTNVRATGTNWGVYVEDLIRARQNLSIRLGVRVDREEINSNGFTRIMAEDESRQFLRLAGPDATGPAANFAARNTFTAFEGVDDFAHGLALLFEENPDLIGGSLSSTIQQSRFWKNTRHQENITLVNTNLSPAIAVSWDPWSNNKTRVAFTARRYYDKIFLNIPLIELEPVTTDLLFEAEEVPDIAGQFDDPDLRGSINPAVNVSVVDRNLATPYQDEFSFSFEREIAAETSIGLSYINRKFRDQFQDTDVNHSPGDFGRCKAPSRLSPSNVEAVQPGDPDYIQGVAPGDGILDDCTGEIVIPDCRTPGSCADVFDALTRFELPDGVPDLYLQNPGWGDIYLVGNFNRIDYEGYVLALTRRQYRNWEMQLSYTWSKIRGDGEDFAQELGDDRSLLQDEQGFQSYDQRHVVKLNATTITRWGFRLGTAIRWESGLPFSLLTQELSFHQVPPPYNNLGSSNSGRVRTNYPTHQRNDQRNASYWNVDVKVAKEMNVGRRLNMQASAEVFNLLNDNTYTIWNPLTRSGQRVNGINTAFRRFGRRWQLGLKMAF